MQMISKVVGKSADQYDVSKVGAFSPSITFVKSNRRNKSHLINVWYVFDSNKEFLKIEVLAV